MAIPRRAVDLVRRAAGRGAMEGNFDGLNGHVFTGWLQDGRGGVVTLMFGSAAVARVRADTPRSDLAAAGIAGAGFIIPVATLETYLKAAVIHGDSQACVLKVVSGSGAVLGRVSHAFTALDLLNLISVAIAVRTLDAPIQGAFLDIY